MYMAASTTSLKLRSSERAGWVEEGGVSEKVERRDSSASFEGRDFQQQLTYD
jgi:hypothetical protein